MKTKKFLPKIKVIELLKNGWEIYSRRNESFGSKGQLIYASRKYTIEDMGEGCHLVHHSTIVALQTSGVIMDKSPYTFLKTA